MEDSRRSRGYLPHIEGGETAQFVTFHLADALPKGVVEKMKEEVKALPESERKSVLAKQVEEYCHAGSGACFLRDPRAARILERKLFKHHGRLYTLHAWCIMPNLPTSF